MNKPEWMSDAHWEQWKRDTEQIDREWEQVKAFGERVGILPLEIPTIESEEDNAQE